MKLVFIILISGLLFIPALFLQGEERGIRTVEKSLDRKVDIGKQYLFLIAINIYREWENLCNPVPDAKAIREILTSQYFIDNVIELYDRDATRENIIKTFGKLQKELGTNDSLLIYYAGHGYFDAEITATGFWIPHDGGNNAVKQANWIPNPQVKSIIDRFTARHILLISDSCFSGDILNIGRGMEKRPEKPTKPYIIHALNRTSRQVITSGAMEVVPDKSELAEQIRMALQKNNRQFFESGDLYDEIKYGVHESFPLFGSLKETKHQTGGSYFFFLREPSASSFEPGRVTLKAKTVGTLYIDGAYSQEIKPGICTIKDVEPGSRSLKIIYANGNEEIISIDVDGGKETAVVFIYQPPLKGEIRVLVKSRGSLYLDNAFIMEVGKKGCIISVEPGIHDVTMTYRNGERETAAVEVFKGSKVQAVFLYIPPPLENYFMLTTSFGVSFPLDFWADIMEVGYSPLIAVWYAIKLPGGHLAAGVVTGATIESMKENLEGEFTMYSIPLGLSIGYRFEYFRPFFLFAEAGGGPALITMIIKKNLKAMHR